MSSTQSAPSPSTTSSSNATLTSSTPFFTNNPEPTSGGGGNGVFGGTSTPLYLFTFLATLFVLLFVSCGIVLRSFYLRRQLRRRYEEAIAAGLLPPSIPGMRRRPIGEKPILHDAELVPAEGEKWEYILPVSARLSKTTPPSSDLASHLPTRLDTFRDTVRAAIPSALQRRSQNAHGGSEPSTALPTGSQDIFADVSKVQVSVLIAMPHPHSDLASLKGKSRAASSLDDDEGTVPDVVFGVSHVSVKRGKLEKLDPSS